MLDTPRTEICFTVGVQSGQFPSAPLPCGEHSSFELVLFYSDLPAVGRVGTWGRRRTARFRVYGLAVFRAVSKLKSFHSVFKPFRGFRGW
jgi:hypothetical protein